MQKFGLSMPVNVIFATQNIFLNMPNISIVIRGGKSCYNLRPLISIYCAEGIFDKEGDGGKNTQCELELLTNAGTYYIIVVK